MLVVQDNAASINGATVSHNIPIGSSSGRPLGPVIPSFETSAEQCVERHTCDIWKTKIDISGDIWMYRR